MSIIISIDILTIYPTTSDEDAREEMFNLQYFSEFIMFDDVDSM